MAVTQFMFHRFRVVCRKDVPLIPTGDFDVDLSDSKNEWFSRLVNAPTTCGGTTIDLV